MTEVYEPSLVNFMSEVTETEVWSISDWGGGESVYGMLESSVVVVEIWIAFHPFIASFRRYSDRGGDCMDPYRKGQIGVCNTNATLLSRMLDK